MNAIERLKRDHAILRSKLSVLESALKMGPETWYVVREVCFTLARQLQDHIRREEALIAACRAALSEEVLARLSVEHHDEPQHLRTINRLFTRESRQTLEHIQPALLEVIRGLRHHMEEEEASLFPTLERVLGRQRAAELQLGQMPRRLDETMTVNRVLQQHPETRAVFEESFISVPVDGCYCLDEVAWRHGMEGRELLAKLEQAIGLKGSEAQADEDDAWSEPGRPSEPSRYVGR